MDISAAPVIWSTDDDRVVIRDTFECGEPEVFDVEIDGVFAFEMRASEAMAMVAAIVNAVGNRVS